jgi:hypothetical protein
VQNDASASRRCNLLAARRESTTVAREAIDLF